MPFSLATTSLMGWTEFASTATLEAAFSCCDGSYQSDLINGGESWSGSTLKGSAKKYGSSYRTSRTKLIAKLEAAGLHFVVTPLLGQKHHTAIIW